MLFLGAGASKPLGIPTMEGFTNEVISVLIKSNKGSDPDILNYVENVKHSVTKLGMRPDIESILTSLSGLSDPEKVVDDIGPLLALFTDRKKPRILSKSVNPMGAQIIAFVASYRIESIIYDRCERMNRSQALELYGKFFDKITGIDTLPYPGPSTSIVRINGSSLIQNIFTTNYDLSIEAFLRGRNISFEDGFAADGVGDFAFTANWGGGGVRLFKLHGSINYFVKGDGKIVRLSIKPRSVDFYGEKVKEPMMIYPIGEKHATKYPFYEYLGHLRQILMSEPVCIVVGYSFRDVPINNAFIDGVSKNKNLRIILLSPSATKVRENLDESLRNRLRAINMPFEEARATDTIAEAVQSWRPVNWRG